MATLNEERRSIPHIPLLIFQKSYLYLLYILKLQKNLKMKTMLTFNPITHNKTTANILRSLFSLSLDAHIFTSLRSYC